MIIRLRARLRRSEAADGGLSLIELLVAMSVAMIMLVLIGRMFAQVTRAGGDAQATKTATGIASTVIDEVTRVVRQGTQVSTSASSLEGAVLAGSTPTALTVDTFANATVAAGQATITPIRVAFTVDGSGSLVETRYTSTVTNGYATFATAASSTRVVNGPILTSGTGANALFVYLDRTGAQIAPAASGLTAAQAIGVTAVVVNVSVTARLSTGSSVVSLTNKVTMPNLAIVNGGY